MAESFENLDNILRGWAKDKVQKKSCRCIEQVREAGRRKIKLCLLENRFRKNTRAVSVSSRTRLNQAQNWHGVGKPRTIALSRI